jgi:preprotein translocase subunit SecD
VIILALFGFAVGALVTPMFGREEMRLGLDLKGGIHMVYQADLSQVNAADRGAAIDSTIAVIERRINALGVTEPIIQKQGEDRILVELPGVSEAEKAKSLVGQTSILEFREQVTDKDGNTSWVPATAVIDGQEKELTSAYFKENTRVTTDELGRLLLIFEWNDEGSKLSEEITGRLIGQPLGIFMGDEPLLGEDGKPIAPIVRAKITSSGQIEGLSFNEATELSKLLNAGRIPVPLTPIYEESVSPTLGAHFVDLSIKAGVIGIILIMLFMIAYYRLPGLVSSIALVFYGALVMALFKLIPVTLTLSGIAGFIVSIGMAVDANVLIFERMKEELRAGQTLGAAIETGFNRAWPAIRDSNVTTFIACIILYWLGSSVAASAPVMGFALTLFIGVAVSMFTAITVTRALLRPLARSGLGQRISLFTIYAGSKQ